MTLSLYPTIPYSQALEHSVTVELRIQCCLLEILSLQPIVGFLSRAVGPVCSRTGDAVVPTSFLSLEGCGVGSEITSLVV